MPIDYRFGDGSTIGGSPITQLDVPPASGSGYPQINPALVPAGARMRLGQIVKAYDFSSTGYGEGEFQYIKFTGAVVAGDVVLLDQLNFRGIQAASGAVTTGRGRVGIAMASHPNAATTNDFGFVMIRGVHTFANVATLGAGQNNLPMYLSATAGRMSTGVVANYKCDGIFARVDTFTAGPTEGNFIELQWPTVSGNG